MKYNAITEKTAIKRSFTIGAAWYLETPRVVADGGIEARWSAFPERLELTTRAVNPYNAVWQFAKKFLPEHGFHGMKVTRMYPNSKMFSIHSAGGQRCDVEVVENER